MNALNPFELFGVTESSSLEDVRKAYYSLALVCHPDKGGDADSMKLITIAYKWIYEQLRASSMHHKSFQEYFGDTIEKESLPSFTNTIAEAFGYTRDKFIDICEKVAIRDEERDTLYIPTFQWIHNIFHTPPSHPDEWYSCAYEFLETYKKVQEGSKNMHTHTYIPISIEHGYGSIMHNRSEPIANSHTYTYNETKDSDTYYMSHSNEYIKTMTIYKEPSVLINASIASLEHPEKLENYSLDTPIPMYDYEEAFTLYMNIPVSSNEQKLSQLLEEKELERKFQDSTRFS